MGKKSSGNMKHLISCDKPLKSAFILSPLFLTMMVYFWASSIHLPKLSHGYFNNNNINEDMPELICQNDDIECLSKLSIDTTTLFNNAMSEAHIRKPLILPSSESSNTLRTSLDSNKAPSRPFTSVLKTNNTDASSNSTKLPVTKEQIAAKEVEKIMADLRRSASHHDPSYLINSGIGSGRTPSCENKWVFVYNLPSKFNTNLLSNCKELIPWQNMCDYLSNFGMGQVLNAAEKDNQIIETASGTITIPAARPTSQQALLPAGQWYKTHQYALEIIFHERLKHYPCLTTDASIANLFYIPYYGGLDVLRWHFAPNSTNEKRDKLAFELIQWLQQQESWRKHNGADHVVVLGKISWDFRRSPTGNGWGNSLLLQKEMQNLTKLLIERQPWHENDVGVPHPTFFHPRFDKDIRLWQGHIDAAKRRHLVSFAGLPRPGQAESIRSQLIKQCMDSMSSSSSSQACYFMSCTRNACMQPNTTMDLFVHSEFCLQPPGDSPTRRSIFDSLIGGCIPVLFDPYSAYYQYPWHLPADPTQYSVYFPAEDIRQGKINVVEELAKIPRRVRKEMRLRIIYEIMPGLVYAKPGSLLRGVEDAFLISMRSLLSRVSDRVGSHKTLTS